MARRDRLECGQKPRVQPRAHATLVVAVLAGRQAGQCVEEPEGGVRGHGPAESNALENRHRALELAQREGRRLLIANLAELLRVANGGRVRGGPGRPEALECQEEHREARVAPERHQRLGQRGRRQTGKHPLTEQPRPEHLLTPRPGGTQISCTSQAASTPRSGSSPVRRRSGSCGTSELDSTARQNLRPEGAGSAPDGSTSVATSR